MYAYVYIDVSRKQEFIYRHNRLKDNLFNSGIIKAVTENLYLFGSDQSNRQKLHAEEEEHDRDYFPNDDYDRVVKTVIGKLELSLNGFLNQHYCGCYSFEFSGGGNSIIRFDTEEHAKKFVRNYSRAVLKYYPELELYMSIVALKDLQSGKIDDMEIRKKLIEKSDKLKDKRRIVFRRWTYGLEALDESGKAKVHTSAQLQQLNAVRELLSSQLRKALNNKSEAKYTIQLQDYKEHAGGKSYIGVIAIDGNRMGEIVSRLKSFEQLRKFSEIIHKLYLEAVVQAIDMFSLKKQNKTGKTLKYTPIVLAGDDVCLITEGEYAIQLAAQVVKNIQQLSAEEHYCTELQVLGCNEPLTACAGVSIVKVSYPFFEAVRASEDLCHSAKEAMYKVQENVSIEQGRRLKADPEKTLAGYSSSFINWSIVEGQVREKSSYSQFVENRNLKQKFHIKPLRIDQELAYDNGIFSYDSFEELAMKIGSLSQKSTFLHKLKQAQYNGWEAYQLLFEMNKMEISAQIQQIVQSQYKACGADVQYAVLRTKSDGKNTLIYILNDVLEAIDFLTLEETKHAANSISDRSGTA